MASVVDGNGAADKPSTSEDEDVQITESPTELNGPEDHNDELGSNNTEDQESENTEENGDGREDEGEDEEEDETDDDEGDDDGDDDDEPILKYERIGEEIPVLLKKDSASSLSIGKHIMVWLYLNCYLYF
jgi:vacuolar protein sorting-associated protein 41